jgi:D-3-phosphoglycerate dehydrogenase
MARVLICDKLDADGLAILAQAHLEVDNRPGLKGEALQAALQAADGAIVRSGTRITAELLENPGRLRALVRAGVGVDNIDVPAATRKGVVVMNTPSGNTLSTCEHTWALILSLVRQIPAADAVLRQGGWDRSKFLGTQLAGKTLGVMGLGRIGRAVAARARAFEMKVIGYDPVLASDRMIALGLVPALNLETILKQADLLTLHVPYTEETKNLIGAAQIALMKKGARLINCARGGIVEESALVDALQSGHLAGAALDVFTQEPPPADHPLRALPNVVLSPHLGAATLEAQRSVALEAAELMVNFLTRGQVHSAVNLPALDREELHKLRPYLDAARRLGLLLTQLSEGSLRQITLTFRGDLPAKGMTWLSAALAVGLLETRLSELLSPVNAQLLAKERGIHIREQHDPAHGDFSSLLTVEMQTDQSSHSVSATLFGRQYLRIVEIDGFQLEGYLDGDLLILTHQDMPGLIGHIGTAFGRSNVNIAQMAVGRKTPGGQAIAVLNLDSSPSEEAIAAIKEHPYIKTLRLIHLPVKGELPTWLM